VATPGSASTTVIVDVDYTLRANFAIDHRTLTTSSTNGGSVTSPGEGSFLYDLGSEVIVTATASTNYHFVQWSGDIWTTQNPITVTMDADYAIQADFALDQRALTVSSASGGSVSEPGEGAFLYVGYAFVNWTGTAVDAGKVMDADSASTNVTVDGDYTLQANFTVIRRVLTISSTSGGSVTTPGEGNLQYAHGTVVSVIASPATGHAFVKWTGTAVDAGKVADTGSASTSVTVDGDYTLQANFAVEQRTLTTSSTNGGAVTMPGEGAFQYDYGTVVPVVASVSPGYGFVNWTGTAVHAGKVPNATLASTSVTVDGDYTLHANFAIIGRALTISSTTGGSVTGPGEGTLQYNHGEVVSLVASPDVGYAFVNWTGTAVDAGKVADTSSASTSVTVDADYTLQANFAAISRTLTISSTTGGSVTTPGEGEFQYDHGQVVPVVASADDGCVFVNWTGTAVDGGKVADATSPTTDVTVDGSYTLRANFARKVDLNRDGQLDGRDVETFSQAWLSVPGDHEWNVVCDLNNDEHIDWLDWAIFASAWNVEEN
jgi:hypothetical protein